MVHSRTTSRTIQIFGTCIWRRWSMMKSAKYGPFYNDFTMRLTATSQLVFLYKLVEGVASSSFGTHVANLAGVPIEVVKRAEVVSEDFARQFKEKLEGKQRKSSTARLPLVA